MTIKSLHFYKEGKNWEHQYEEFKDVKEIYLTYARKNELWIQIVTKDNETYSIQYCALEDMITIEE